METLINFMLLFWKKHIFSLAVVLVIVLTILSIILVGAKIYKDFTVAEKIDEDAYQAVFLTNNQIYFGRLEDEESAHPVLRDVYYVQIGETVAGKEVSKLVRLGETEAHGPKNEMVLNKEHILFWENLNFGSQIVQAIQNYKK